MTLKELPQINISRHARAKHLRLRVDANSIRLTVPTFTSDKQIQQFIDQSTPWLLETWQKQQQKVEKVEFELPTQLQFFNLEKAVQVVYGDYSFAARYEPSEAKLYIDHSEAAPALKAFIKSYATQQLPGYFHRVAHQQQIRFSQVKIREAKTRWGSCSAKHDIMLNAALVLCPEHIVRYVCVHELAHTRHFDHSPAFWAEVEQHDPNCQQHRKELKNIKIPMWYQ